jgi:hypothetical protein
MANLYDDFEKRHAFNWFSANWADAEVKKPTAQVFRKNLTTLQSELEEIQEHIEMVSQKQLRLSNLAKLYDITE